MGYCQTSHLSTQDHYEVILNHLEVYVHNGGSTDPSPGTIERCISKFGWDANSNTDAQKTEAREREWAVAFIRKGDKVQYGALISSLRNEYIQGVAKYPRALFASYNWLVYWEESHSLSNVTLNDGVTFSTISTDRQHEDTMLATTGQAKQTQI